LPVNRNRTKLDCLPNLRIEMSKLYRQAKTGRLELEKATRLVAILREIRCCLEAEAIANLAMRMEAIQERTQVRLPNLSQHIDVEAITQPN
jgi:hypothetical protein